VTTTTSDQDRRVEVRTEVLEAKIPAELWEAVALAIVWAHRLSA
jgi:hypothetical protein